MPHPLLLIPIGQSCLHSIIPLMQLACSPHAMYALPISTNCACTFGKWYTSHAIINSHMCFMLCHSLCTIITDGHDEHYFQLYIHHVTCMICMHIVNKDISHYFKFPAKSWLFSSSFDFEVFTLFLYVIIYNKVILWSLGYPLHVYFPIINTLETIFQTLWYTSVTFQLNTLNNFINWL